MRMHATRRWEDCCEFSDLVSPGFGCKILRLRPARAVRVPRRTPVEWPVFSLRNQSLPPSLPQSVKPAQPEASASPFRSVLRSDIPMAVRAMNVGAIDFLTKPVDDAAPLKSVAWAFQLDRANRREAIEHESSSLDMRLDAWRARGVGTVGPRFAKQASCVRVGDHRVHCSSPSRTHYAKDGSGLFCHR